MVIPPTATPLHPDPTGSCIWLSTTDFHLLSRSNPALAPVGDGEDGTDGHPAASTGQPYVCDPKTGGVCDNRKQPRGQTCRDDRVRFCC